MSSKPGQSHRPSGQSSRRPSHAAPSQHQSSRHAPSQHQGSGTSRHTSHSHVLSDNKYAAPAGHNLNSRNLARMDKWMDGIDSKSSGSVAPTRRGSVWNGGNVRTIHVGESLDGIPTPRHELREAGTQNSVYTGPGTVRPTQTMIAPVHPSTRSHRSPTTPSHYPGSSGKSTFHRAQKEIPDVRSEYEPEADGDWRPVPKQKQIAKVAEAMAREVHGSGRSRSGSQALTHRSSGTVRGPSSQYPPQSSRSRRSNSVAYPQDVGFPSRYAPSRGPSTSMSRRPSMHVGGPTPDLRRTIDGANNMLGQMLNRRYEEGLPVDPDLERMFREGLWKEEWGWPDFDKLGNKH